MSFKLKKQEDEDWYDWRKLYFGLIKSRWRWRRGVGRTFFDEHFRVLIVGDKKTGKSSVALRLIKNNPSRDLIQTTFSKDELSNITTYLVDVVTHKTVKLHIYDSNIIDMATYVRAVRMNSVLCHGTIIVFNLGSKRSFFNAINRWYSMVQNKGYTTNIFLVGNKCDLPPEKRMVPLEDILLATSQKGIPYIEVSATKGDNIENLLQMITNILYSRIVENRLRESRWSDIIEKEGKVTPVMRTKFLTVPKPEQFQLSDFENIYTESIELNEKKRAEENLRRGGEDVSSTQSSGIPVLTPFTPQSIDANQLDGPEINFEALQMQEFEKGDVFQSSFNAILKQQMIDHDEDDDDDDDIDSDNGEHYLGGSKDNIIALNEFGTSRKKKKNNSHHSDVPEHSSDDENLEGDDGDAFDDDNEKQGIETVPKLAINNVSRGNKQIGNKTHLFGNVHQLEEILKAELQRRSTKSPPSSQPQPFVRPNNPAKSGKQQVAPQGTEKSAKHFSTIDGSGLTDDLLLSGIENEKQQKKNCQVM